jgi:hypothetical protein
VKEVQMQALQWNARTIALFAVAAVLAASVGVMGVWLLLNGQVGAAISETSAPTSTMNMAGQGGMTLAPALHSGASAGVGAGQQPGATMDTSAHDQMMGVPANRGALGGYTGTVGLVVILAFIAMVGLLLYAAVKERPGQRQPTACWNCERPVEVDWEACPYCGARLDDASRSALSAEAEPREAAGGRVSR